VSRMTLRRIFLKFLSGIVISSLAVDIAAAAEPFPGKARLNLVFILDGLRPDSINSEDTPSLFKFRQEGVNYSNGHSVFPTVTRVNATAIATGTYPGTNGIVGNTLYVPKVNPNRAFNNDDYKNLLKLDEVTEGNMVLVKSLGELLHARGMKLAAVSSGSNGQTLLLNPRAPKGVGILINGYLEPGILLAYPPNVNSDVVSLWSCPTQRRTERYVRRLSELDPGGPTRVRDSSVTAGRDPELDRRTRSHAACLRRGIARGAAQHPKR
jgi:Type I phosphodiesterase / nucleotide pyrophosphatase